MNVFPSTTTRTTRTRRFSLYCRRFLLILLLVVSSSAWGFSTAFVGKQNEWQTTNRQNRRSRVRYGGYTTALVRQHAVTTLHLSFSPELPDVISTYSYCLKYHYFPTQSLTNAILTVVGDGLAQTHEENQRQAGSSVLTTNYYDMKRGLVYFFKGLGSGIMWAWWFDMADVWSMELTQSVLGQEAADFASNKVLTIQAQSTRTAINIFLEQFLVCPILFSLWDIPVTSLMRGSPIHVLPDQIREKLSPLLVANAKVWTLANVVTYNIPLEYRLLFASAASIVSETINSGITSKQITLKPQLPLVSDNSITELGATLPSSALAAVGGNNATAVLEF